MSTREIRLQFSAQQESNITSCYLKVNVCHLEGKVKKRWLTENVSIVFKTGRAPTVLSEEAECILCTHQGGASKVENAQQRNLLPLVHLPQLLVTTVPCRMDCSLTVYPERITEMLEFLADPRVLIYKNHYRERSFTLRIFSGVSTIDWHDLWHYTHYIFIIPSFIIMREKRWRWINKKKKVLNSSKQAPYKHNNLEETTCIRCKIHLQPLKSSLATILPKQSLNCFYIPLITVGYELTSL